MNNRNFGISSRCDYNDRVRMFQRTHEGDIEPTKGLQPIWHDILAGLFFGAFLGMVILACTIL